MKKRGNAVAWMLAAGMILSLASCAQDGAGNPGLESLGADVLSEDGEMQAAGNRDNSGDGEMQAAGNGDNPGDGLRLLASQEQEGCYTEDGYYYLPHQPESLSDGTYGSRLMYMDFASLQEVYLCSNAGCNHNSADCQAVCTYEDFPPSTTRLFIYRDALWMLAMAGDPENVVYEEFGVQGSSLGPKMDMQGAVLYRMNLDGTGRRKVHTFEQNVALEDLVLGDGEGIYVVEKELSAQRDGTTYDTAASRRLVRVNPDTGEEEEVCSLDFGDGIQWRIMGGYGDSILLSGTDYKRTYTTEEYYDEDAYKELLENSEEIYVTLDLDSGQKTEQYRISNREENCASLAGNVLYVSSRQGGGIKAIDLDTGAERTLCEAQGNYYYIWDVIGDKLCCKDQSFGQTFYYIDRNTGTVSYSPLTNISLGWSLEFRAVLERDVLVIYDYEAIDNGDGSYEIKRYQYGLISREDLVAGNGNYRRIQMVGTGQ